MTDSNTGSFADDVEAAIDDITIPQVDAGAALDSEEAQGEDQPAELSDEDRQQNQAVGGLYNAFTAGWHSGLRTIGFVDSIGTDIKGAWREYQLQTNIRWAGQQDLSDVPGIDPARLPGAVPADEPPVIDPAVLAPDAQAGVFNLPPTDEQLQDKEAAQLALGNATSTATRAVHKVVDTDDPDMLHSLLAEAYSEVERLQAVESRHHAQDGLWPVVADFFNIAMTGEREDEFNVPLPERIELYVNRLRGMVWAAGLEKTGDTGENGAQWYTYTIPPPLADLLVGEPVLDRLAGLPMYLQGNKMIQLQTLVRGLKRDRQALADLTAAQGQALDTGLSEVTETPAAAPENEA